MIAGRHVPRKRFGQHFLVSVGVIRNIIDAVAATADDKVVEIGPGQGALTRPLLERVASLDVLEIDRDLAAALRSQFPAERLRVHEGDALVFDFCSLGQGLRVVGNLPYNISTPLLFHLADAAACLRDCHFMLQREVVERMAAVPGGKDYGRLSVMLQARFHVTRLFRVPAGAFWPAPQVESAVVRLTPRQPPLWAPAGAAAFAAVVAKAFGQRRKTLRNALRGVLSENDLRAAAIDPGARPETLAVEDFVRLAARVAQPPTAAPVGAG